LEELVTQGLLDWHEIGHAAVFALSMIA